MLTAQVLWRLTFIQACAQEQRKQYNSIRVRDNAEARGVCAEGKATLPQGIKKLLLRIRVFNYEHDTCHLLM